MTEQKDPGSEERRFQLLVDAVTDYAIYMLDPQGYITSWNSGAQRFKGYLPREIIGQHFSRFYTDEDRATDLPKRALRTAAQEGRFEQEGWRIRKDGTRFWAHVIIDPIRDPATGELIGFGKVTRDMTERKIAQESLRRSEEQFRLLVQGVTDYAIYMLDPEGRVSNWNTGAQRIKGYTEDEIVGRHFSQFYTPEERALGLPAVSLRTAAQEGRFEKEGWRVRKDGTRFWAGVVIDPIIGPDGTLIGYAKITRDLTERRQTQEALEQARNALFQSQKMEAIGQLTGGIAHDFNNLLTVIVNGLDLLSRRLDDPKDIKILEGMHRAAERGSSLNHQLLAFARRQPLKPEIANPNAIIAGFEAVLRRAGGERVHMELSLAQRLSPVKVDIPQFEAALLNLVVNARDAMPEGGTIALASGNVQLDTVRARKLGLEPGPYVSVAVTDTGSGIPDELKNRVFEPFFTTKEVGKGTGLGLSQVYGFVTQSGGQIEIESELGHGTRMTLLIPATDADGEIENGAAEDDDARPARSTLGTALIVEDQPDVLDIAVQIFESLGYDVLTAINAAEALDVLRQDVTIDVLFSDVVMPGDRNGVELAREARRMRPGLKVLLASGYPMSALDKADLSEVSFISKPYRWTELDEKLRVLRTG
ncbi:PAS domain S-box protein [Microvirga sp. BT291]|nr:PAS domain S-box protein [Microvirga pudoricolor]